MNKKLLTLIICLIAVPTLRAQMNVNGNTFYGNEWINFSQNYYKIKIVREGLYRIPYALLNSTSGLNIATTPGNQFQLFRDGKQVPIFITNNGILNNTDYIEFYARGNDGFLDKFMYNTGFVQPNPEFSLYTDTASYFLTVGNAAQSLRIITEANNVVNGTTPDNNVRVNKFCFDRASMNFNRGKHIVLTDGSGDHPLDNSLYTNGEGFNMAELSANNTTSNYIKSFSDVLLGIDNGTILNNTTLNIIVRLAGRNKTRHHTQVIAKTGTNENLLCDTTFNETEFISINKNINTNLVDNTSQLIIRIVDDNPDGKPDRQKLMGIVVGYNRTTNFAQINPSTTNRNNYRFLGNSNNPYYEITGINATGTPIFYDITNSKRYAGIVSSNVIKVQTTSNSTFDNEYFISSSSDITTITTLNKVEFVNYNLNKGDYIIISDINKFQSELTSYKSFRSERFSNPVIIDINQLYEQYGYGCKLHPIAIRNFCNYAYSNWSVNNAPPKYVLIIGKGINYSDRSETTNVLYRNVPNTKNIVPSFGMPASDNLLTSLPNTIVPQIPIGRLACTQGQEIMNYLSKIKQMEDDQRLISTNPASLYWTKNITHIGGGSDLGEQQLIKNYLLAFKSIAENIYLGGIVTSFYKNSTDPVQAASSSLDSVVNKGTSLLTYVGHGSPDIIEYNINDPDYYNNPGKNPVLYMQGCDVGYIFGDYTGTISEDWTLFRDKLGSIITYADADVGVTTDIYNYATDFYENFSNQHYGESFGNIVKYTVQDNANAAGSLINLVNQNIIHGDPAFIPNPLQKPDFEIKNVDVNTIPSELTPDLENFQIKINTHNLAKAIPDSINLQIKINNVVAVNRRIKSPKISDSYTFMIDTSFTTVGQNNLFEVKIDAANEQNEYNENNNVVTFSRFILSNDIFPISPSNFGIVPTNRVELQATTGNAFQGLKNYAFEIDTTETFSSAFKRSTNIATTGGVVSWTPPITLQDSTVYYWRTRINDPLEPNAIWKNRSFIYLENEYPGWNQSHYDQYKSRYYPNSYRNLRLDNDTVFKFPTISKKVSYINRVMDATHRATFSMYYEGELILNEGCFEQNNYHQAGFAFAVIDPSNGEIKSNTYNSAIPATGYNNFQGFYNEIVCDINPNYPEFVFYFPTERADVTDPFSITQRRQNIIDFLNHPDIQGKYIFVMSVNQPDYTTFNTTNPTLISLMESKGATNFSSLITDPRPFAFYFKNGDPTFNPRIIYADSLFDHISGDASFNFDWHEGDMTSVEIGPALEWHSLHWRTNTADNPNNDNNKVTVIGVSSNNTQTVLFNGISARDFYFTGSNTINANTYPKLILKYFTEDTTHQTPGQVGYWRILYKELPEAVLSPNIAYQFFADTLQVGETLNLNVAIKNISRTNMDSLQVNFKVIDANNVEHTIAYPLQAPLLTNDTLLANVQYTTVGLEGLNKLKIDVNPLDHPKNQPEQYHYNNVATIPFYVVADKINPLLDVTFDSKHILNGDIVAPKPLIRIKLKDENKYLSLSDSSLVRVRIKYPDGTVVTMNTNNSGLIFTPASGNLTSNNVATVELNPEFFDDGEYELQVVGRDASSNTAEATEYKVAFTIVREESVSYVLNYPNPFTTSTRFVFTLTGTEVPDNFKIQIMTVSGKVVREVSREELGNITIGRNMSDFAWDGTDMFGDRLANGVYLYRVVVSNNGKKYKRYTGFGNRDNGIGKLGQYFKNDIGKMYLMR